MIDGDDDDDDRFILRNWLMPIVGTGKSEIYRAGQQARDQRRGDVAAQIEKQSGSRIPSSSRALHLFSVKAFN